MELLQVLLNKYWTGSITEQELGLLMNLLKEIDHDNIVDYEQEINSFNEGRNEPSAIPDAEELLRRIHLKIGEEQDKKKPALVRILFNRLKWVAAALVFFFFARHLIQQRSVNDSLGKPISQTRIPQKPKPGTQVIANTTARVQWVQLADSSIVRLFPGSTLSFSDSFNIISRDIVLQGKASFKVAKNAEKPFSVNSNDVVTKALGTHFIVDGTKGGKRVSIRLLEGKVVIYHAKSQSRMKPIYILPGQVCIVKPDEMKAEVKQWKQKDTDPPVITKHVGTLPKQPTSLEFNRTPLPDVFKRIEDVYKIKIDYNTAGEEKTPATFTGNFRVEVAAELLIKIICQTNDLSFEKKGSVYFISSMK